ncbi:hypothetical protein Tco_1037556 [Tanacetum coccineum]
MLRIAKLSFHLTSLLSSASRKGELYLKLGLDHRTNGVSVSKEIKELEALAPEFNNEFCENSSFDEESMEDEEFNSQKVDDIDHISESSCMKEGNEQQAPKTSTESEDPFGIYLILKRNNQKEKSKDAGKSDPSFPPGITPKGVNETIEEEENVSVNKSNSNHVGSLFLNETLIYCQLCGI